MHAAVIGIKGVAVVVEVPLVNDQVGAGIGGEAAVQGDDAAFIDDVIAAGIGHGDAERRIAGEVGEQDRAVAAAVHGAAGHVVAAIGAERYGAAEFVIGIAGVGDDAVIAERPVER